MGTGGGNESEMASSFEFNCSITIVRDCVWNWYKDSHSTTDSFHFYRSLIWLTLNVFLLKIYSIIHHRYYSFAVMDRHSEQVDTQ
jgi:hypothetical protein